MDQEDAKVVQKKYVRLAKTLEAQTILGFLYQEGALSDHDKEKIGALSISEEKAEKLMDILKKRKDGLKMLIKALLVSRVQGFLGNELLETVTWSEEEMETFKLELEGKIDQQQIMEANMAALKRENKQLKARLDETVKTLQEKEDVVNVLTKELNEKEEKVEALNEKNEKAVKQFTEIKEELERLKQENHQLNLKITSRTLANIGTQMQEDAGRIQMQRQSLFDDRTESQRLTFLAKIWRFTAL